MNLTSAQLAMRTAIQKVATGPEYSKNLSQDEAYAAMEYVLSEGSDPVQTAVFFIALRMKRETDDENKGVLKAIIDKSKIVTAAVDEVVDIGDPYDGHSRGLPMASFLPAVLAECGVAAICHGLESIGPKYGVTHRKVLRAAGVDVDLTVEQAAARLADSKAGWAYIDQSQYSPDLYNLSGVRARMIKRQVLTTVEVLVGPIRGKKQTHLLTGYVHKAYPPIYAELARFAGFDSAMIVRGVEGGVIPSLQQAAKLYSYKNKGAEIETQLDPTALGIQQETRAVPIPKDLTGVEAADDIANPVDPNQAAARAAEFGLAALKGEAGPARDSLVYSASIVLHHLGRYPSQQAAADAVRQVLDSGKVLTRLKA